MNDTSEMAISREEALARLKVIMDEIRANPEPRPHQQGEPGWLKKIQGSVSDVEAYREIVRLGREISLKMDEEDDSK